MWMAAFAAARSKECRSVLPSIATISPPERSLSAAVQGRLGVRLVQQTHQREVEGGGRGRRVIAGGAVQPAQRTWSAEADGERPRVEHRPLSFQRSGPLVFSATPVPF